MPKPPAARKFSAPCVLSSGTYVNSTTLTGWTTALAAFNRLKAVVNSASSLTDATITIYGRAAFQSINVIRNSTATNHGVPSSSSNDWVGGSTNLANADTAFAAAGVSVVMVMLGTNDAGNGVATTPSQYATNIASLCAQEVGLGRTVILNYPPAFNPSGTTFADYDQTALARLETYLAQIDSLINGTTILRGDQAAFGFFAAHQDQLYTDGVHMTNTGNQNLADMWASALNKALNPGSGSSTLAIAY